MVVCTPPRSRAVVAVWLPFSPPLRLGNSNTGLRCTDQKRRSISKVVSGNGTNRSVPLSTGKPPRWPDSLPCGGRFAGRCIQLHQPGVRLERCWCDLADPDELRLMLMSSGRTATIRCGELGSIEFVHTKKRPSELADRLTYDARCHLWRASVSLAIRDMKATRRSLDLVDWEVVDDSV